MDGDFAIHRSLVQAVLPRIRFLFIESWLCSTLPSDPASRRRTCVSLALHLHQVVQGTCTPKLSNMLGTRLPGSRMAVSAVEPLRRRPSPSVHAVSRQLTAPVHEAQLRSLE